MLLKNKINKRFYELTNEADGKGVCQVLDIETGYVCLMNFSELKDPCESALNLLPALMEGR